MARKYQGIWEQLKTTGTCTVAASPTLHERIKKAVTKEKYIDTAYKILWDLEGTEQPKLAVSRAKDATGKPVKNTLCFRLIKPVLLGDL